MQMEACVETNHAFTARMCAATRWEESQRRADSLFYDPLSYRLAGAEGRAQPMGSWIMVPRTRFGDDLLEQHYYKASGCRQLVLLGAGMDARAFRMHLPELAVFEVDQKTIFDVKEPLVQSVPLTVRSRMVVPTEFADRDGKIQWARDLEDRGFDRSVPTVWLLEGLLMYLSLDDTKVLMDHVGALSAPGSVVFHDAISKSYLRSRIVVAGAPFIGGSDDYKGLWMQRAGFFGKDSWVYSFSSVHIDRRQRRLWIDYGAPEATPGFCAGHSEVLFVVVEK